ncbi:DNA-processing protein DprA [Streptomyces zhihengii]|uniref:DNA-processing protein DprA n=1 Tax=Streptomyces zhihengii TaxID=1818004 RepID=A0ABS2UNH6_9ACTN|nr:DNA-processing protein DprA [Streptomyces zhihengii]
MHPMPNAAGQPQDAAEAGRDRGGPGPPPQARTGGTMARRDRRHRHDLDLCPHQASRCGSTRTTVDRPTRHPDRPAPVRLTTRIDSLDLVQRSFVLRNRVIAALTRGTVVVEAEYRSGSLVTARGARRLGRFVMGVPGPATSGLSAGVHELLRGEGVLVTDAAEVVELVGDMGALAPERLGPVLPRDVLEPVGRQVLEALPGRGTATVREVARAAGVPEDEALGRLYELQSLGFTERHGTDWKLAPRPIRGSNARRGGA